MGYSSFLQDVISGRDIAGVVMPSTELWSGKSNKRRLQHSAVGSQPLHALSAGEGNTH